MWETIVTEIGELTPHIFLALLVFGAFWIGGSVLRKVIIRVGESRRFDRYLARLFGKTARVAMIIVGVVTALGTVGVDVTALVAGVGLTGFALGFALKDIVSNVLSGILIIIYKPFQHGDGIKVSSFEGTVTNIDLRYTTLDTGDAKIFVPNSLLFTNAITVRASADEHPPEADDRQETA
jgi:small-conductance mechanosensitive channel